MDNINLIDYYDWTIVQGTKMIAKLVHDMYLQLQNWSLFVPPNIIVCKFSLIEGIDYITIYVSTKDLTSSCVDLLETWVFHRLYQHLCIVITKMPFN